MKIQDLTGVMLRERLVPPPLKVFCLLCKISGMLYRNYDLDTIINFLAKQSISRESGPKQVRLLGVFHYSYNSLH